MKKYRISAKMIHCVEEEIEAKNPIEALMMLNQLLDISEMDIVDGWVEEKKAIEIKTLK